MLGAEELADDARFATNALRVAARDELVPLLAALLKAKPTAEWIALCKAAGVPCAPINSVEQAFLQPQAAAREMILEAEHATCGTVKMAGFPVTLSDTPATLRSAPPVLGADTEDVLREYLGLDAAAVGDLAAAGVVAS